MNNAFFEFLIASLTSGVLLLAAVFFVLQKMLKAESSRRNVELLIESKKLTLPLRLQAYERLLLLMERISPEALVVRLRQTNTTNADFHASLIATVRSEFEHNLSQQLYVSSEVWQHIVLTKNNMIRTINTVAMEMPPTNSSLQLAKRLIEEYVEQEQPTQQTVKMLKKEITQLF